MRFAYPSVAAVVLVGSFLWYRVEHSAASSDGNMQRHLAPATEDRREPPAQNRNASAAKAIRSSVVVSEAQRVNASDKVAAVAQRNVENPKQRSASSDAPATNAIATSELFAPLVEDDPNNVFLASTVQYHAAVRSEAVDPEWAPVAANALRDYLAAQLGDGYEIAQIDCRTDLCEVRIAARAGSDVQSDMQAMQEIVNRAKHEPWWTEAQLDQDMTAVGMSPDGRALLLWFVSRR